MTQFGYFSMQQPTPSSPLRQLAYRDNTDIPGPYLDPDGWHALEPVQIRGTVFGERSVDAKCTVSCKSHLYISYFSFRTPGLPRKTCL